MSINWVRFVSPSLKKPPLFHLCHFPPPSSSSAVIVAMSYDKELAAAKKAATFAARLCQVSLFIQKLIFSLYYVFWDFNNFLVSLFFGIINCSSIRGIEVTEQRLVFFFQLNLGFSLRITTCKAVYIQNLNLNFGCLF